MAGSWVVDTTTTLPAPAGAAGCGVDVAGTVIDVVDDVFYLTCDELITTPADARLRIKRRRAERERLQAQRPPDVIDHAWVPVE